MATKTATPKTEPAATQVEAAPAPEPKLCLCGCGQEVRRQFRPGHDARHASQLVRRYGTGELTAEQAMDIAAKASDALCRKVARGIQVVDAKTAKSAELAKTKADVQAAPAELGDTTK